MPSLRPFAEIAAAPAPGLDELALSLAVDLRPGAVHVDGALERLDELADALGVLLAGAGDAEDPLVAAAATAALLGREHGFTGDTTEYDHPDNSMLDLVLERRRGLPILLSVVYAEVGRRAGLPLAGVGLPGHFVTGHFGAVPPVLLDPFGGGAQVTYAGDPADVRPWTPTETAMRMLNNLVMAYTTRGDLVTARRAAVMRLMLPAEPALRPILERELRAIEERLD
jgi:hypothetical protein